MRQISYVTLYLILEFHEFGHVATKVSCIYLAHRIHILVPYLSGHLSVVREKKLEEISVLLKTVLCYLNTICKHEISAILTEPPYGEFNNFISTINHRCFEIHKFKIEIDFKNSGTVLYSSRTPMEEFLTVKSVILGYTIRKNKGPRHKLIVEPEEKRACPVVSTIHEK